MKSALFSYILIAAWLLISGCIGSSNPVKLPDMRHSYSRLSKKPFGAYIAHEQFATRYEHTSIIDLKSSFADNWSGTFGSKNSLYVLLSQAASFSKEDISSLLLYAATGNQVFIAAEYIDQQLLDTFGIKTNSPELWAAFNQNAALNQMRPTFLSLTEAYNGKSPFSFYYHPFIESFKLPVAGNIKILGMNEEGQPDYISVVHEKGRFYFHLHPQAFSNYFLLTASNYKYAEGALSYLPASRTVIYWDEYYRSGRQPEKNFSAFTIFMKYPMLRYALFTAIGLMLLYIAFAGKRRQRPIALKTPPKNESVSFAETIGRLYLQKKDNINMLHKMITYFMEQLRNKYYLNTGQLDASFISSLAARSGMPEEKVKSFFDHLTLLQEKKEISDKTLLDVNNQMQQFFKK